MAAPVVGCAQEPRTVEVVAVAECVIAGTRRQAGERFVVPGDRVAALVGYGWVLPDAWFSLLHPSAAAAWRQQPREGLTDAALVVDTATVAALWAAAGRILTPEGWEGTSYAPAAVEPGALRVLQLTQYDPGSAVYRYHSAANTVPGIVSAFVRWGDSNPHCSLRQWDGMVHRRSVEVLAMTADVIHVHMDFRTLTHDLRVALAANQRAAITYHGSIQPGETGRVLVEHERDARYGAIQFGARPYHGRYGVTRYLPIPVPVDDYAAAAGPRWTRGHVLRIAHSPTRRAIKGTQALLDAVTYLRDAEGLPVEVVLIENMAHGEALRVKASCHATFDSFFLGMQGSGIEGAAMGQPVIAGEREAADEAAALNGGVCPWTFADDKYQIQDVLRGWLTVPGTYEADARRVHEYVRRVHDYRAVGARYRDYLREA